MTTTKPDAMAASWGDIGSSDPLGFAVPIRPSRYTHKDLMAKKAFAGSISSVDQMDTAE